jgi:predicted ATP-grasp superfamily ATP-dependent carboligase
MSRGKKVLVLGNYRLTLTIIRSLGRAGYHVIVGADMKRCFTDYCRYTNEIWRHPNIKHDETRFIAALNEFLGRSDDKPLIFPVGDSQISCISRNLDRLPTSVVVAMPEPATAMDCENKSRMQEVVEKLGIPQPKSEKARSLSELRMLVERIGCPAVIKPNDSLTPFFGEKAIIINAPDELTAAIPAWPEGHAQLLVQEFARGERYNCQFIAVRGEIVCYFEYKVLRTDRRNDTGYLIEGISVEPTPRLRSLSEALARELKYSGAGCAQFFFDSASGAVNFLEINPRLAATCALPFHSGYDLPRLAVENAEFLAGTRSTPSKETRNYPIGKRTAWLMGDLEAIRRDVRAAKCSLPSAVAWLGESAMMLLRTDCHVTWWWKDPLPSLVTLTRFLKSLFISPKGKNLPGATSDNTGTSTYRALQKSETGGR